MTFQVCTAACMKMMMMMMEAASASETSVNIYQTTRRNNPEVSRLQSCFFLFGP
jgi:type II secretory pathway component PulK